MEILNYVRKISIVLKFVRRTSRFQIEVLKNEGVRHRIPKGGPDRLGPPFGILWFEAILASKQPLRSNIK